MKGLGRYTEIVLGFMSQIDTAVSGGGGCLALADDQKGALHNCANNCTVRVWLDL